MPSKLCRKLTISKRLSARGLPEGPSVRIRLSQNDFWAVEVEFHNEAQCPVRPSSVTRQHNIFGTLIVAETKEDRVPQFSVLSPFCEGNLSNESR